MWNLGPQTAYKFDERQKFMEDYSYDKFGRMTEKRNGMNSSYTYEYGANSLVKKIQYKNETIMDASYCGGIETQLYKNDEMEYYENGTLKGITENYRWKFPKTLYDWKDCYESSGQTKKQYEYDALGNCTVYDANGKRDTDPNSIGNVNPFRWKSFYYDVESGLYYANGSYYDPETGLYVDASFLQIG